MLGKGMSHSVYPGHKIIKPGQNARPIFNAHQIPNYAKLTYPGPVRINAGHPMLLNNPFMPFPQQPIPGNRNIPLNSAVPKGNGKYGNFIKKLTTLSSMFLSQSLGMKSQISPREETKVANEYTVEEIDDVPEAILSGSSTIKRQGLSAKDPKPEWSRRISKPDDIPRPPIIVYKGAKPPVQVYGTKDDIEKAKDPLETSASEHKATISIEGSEIEDDLDFMKDLYTILPKHVKRSIANEMEEEDQLDLKDSETKNESLDDEEDSSPSEVSEDNGQKIKESEDNDALKSSTPDDKSTFAIEEDIEELVKLLHKEEKSDIFQM
ncbi:uncharacterized protein CDAR_227011 [Caerostris darwini]|uniref:Uncharacterized protein n=1 Tax=Caerostris darwini TaxID=1538125 RepID=A0AAV4WLH8_9ARAC|nr:uncharacterized protein CDAR_227011 [Caerostris darwini]